MTTENKELRGMLCTVIGAICWGFSGTCGQYLFQQKNISSLWLTCVRLLTAGVLILLFVIPTQPQKVKQLWHTPKDLLSLGAFAIFGLAFCQYTYLTAISYSNAGTATVLQYCGPVLIMILVCIRNRRLPSIKELLAIILAITGVFLLATHGKMDALVISKEALIWGILAAIALVLYTLIPVRIIRIWGSQMITGFGMMIGGVLISAAVRPWKILVHWDLGTLGGVLGMAVIGTAVAFTLYMQGVQDIGSVKASMIASIEPVAATCFSAIWLHTSFMKIDILGFICIITTVFLLSGKRRTT